MGEEGKVSRDLMRLELQMLMNHLMWVLETTRVLWKKAVFLAVGPSLQPQI